MFKVGDKVVRIKGVFIKADEVYTVHNLGFYPNKKEKYWIELVEVHGRWNSDNYISEEVYNSELYKALKED